MIRIGIAGYGNLGRGVESAVAHNSDMTLAGIFTRRDIKMLKAASAKTPVFSLCEAKMHTRKVDVMVICAGSAADLPEMTPSLASLFNVVDSFDTHAKIAEHFERTDKAARSSGHLALISAGWDPGLFSLARLYFEAVLPNGDDYTFWGSGVSQGHSDAVRRIKGVADARQYTIPVAGALERVQEGERPKLSAREKHRRECFVVPKSDADLAEIERAIKTMPDYFADFDTTVHFITAKEMELCHGGLPHAGRVIRSGATGENVERRQLLELSLKLESNPEFTGSVLAACARAVFRLAKKGQTGCRTLFDIAPAELARLSRHERLLGIL